MFLIRNILLILLAYLILVLGMYIFQRKLLYRPDYVESLNPTEWTLSKMEVINIKTPDGLSLISWYKKSSVGMPTILYFHGNAGTIGPRAQRMSYFMEQGYGLLLLSYRGYSGNDGAPNEHGLYLDAKSAVRYLYSQGMSKDDIIIFGESLGTGVAIEIASNDDFAAMVLQTPYTSIADAAQYNYPFVPAKWLIKDKFDSLSKLNKITIPTIILHGKNDDVVPYYMGETVYNIINVDKEFYSSDYAGHSDILDDDAKISVDNFIKQRINFKNKKNEK